MPYSYHPYPIIGITKALIAAVLLSAALYFIRDLFPQSLLAAGAVWLLALLYSASLFVSSGFKTVTLGDASLTYKSGALATQQFILPYSKITEANYSQGIVERIFGVGTLSVDTPGGTDQPIRLGMVRISDIEKTIDRINAKHK